METGVSGPLAGVRVVELDGGHPAAVAGMLLADQGAEVVVVEPPTGRLVRRLPGARIWDRGKSSVVLDLDLDEGRARLHELVAGADVLVEALRPARVEELGLEPAALREAHPRLVHLTLSAYAGALGEEAEERAGSAGLGLEALVSARLGAYHEQRGWRGTPMDRILGIEDDADAMEPPPGAEQGPERDGPLMVANPWAGLATAFNAALGVSAALLARARTGRGQHLSTSLLQGLLSVNFAAWQRPEKPDAELYRMWVLDRRAPKGLFACRDGRWVHQWPMNPFAVTEASQVEDLEQAAATRNRDDVRRLGMAPDDLVVLHYYYPEMVEAHLRFPADDWVRFSARVDVGSQVVRSHEEALLDHEFAADGTVVTVEDTEEGPILQPGLAFRLGTDAGEVRRGAPALGEHDDLRWEPRAAHEERWQPPAGTGPLAGVRVLDLGLGVAGPWANSLLAELGADVIKVNAQYDAFWMSTHMGLSVNRGKRSLAVNLKDPRGRDLLRRLAASADVVAHNMRTGAAERLGLDAATLQAENPRLIYCHSRGFDRGSRLGLPGTDQTAGALCGTSWEDGGTGRGGAPFWSPTSMGDTGNGWLCAIGIVQALLRREQTGQGQTVDTAIVNAQLLAASGTYVRADGTSPERPQLDAQMLGFSALHRLYGGGAAPTTEDWFAVAATEEQHVEALLGATGLAHDPRFGTAEERKLQDEQLAKELETRFAEGDAASWVARLQEAGVPCEPADARFTQRLFDDARLRELGLTTTQRHPLIGRVDTYGDVVRFDGSPTRPAREAPLVGQHTRELLAELGLSDAEVEGLLAEKVVTST